MQNKEPCLNTAKVRSLQRTLFRNKHLKRRLIQHISQFDLNQNIFSQRFKLFGGEWKDCPGKPNPATGLYSCEEYKKTHPHLRIRNKENDKGKITGRQYYKIGHYDFFQIEKQDNKADPIVAGPNGELYCPDLPDVLPNGMKSNLVTTNDLSIGSNPGDYGCSFDFYRGICYVPQRSTHTMLLDDWERSYKAGNCGPICPVTGRPWFPVRLCSSCDTYADPNPHTMYAHTRTLVFTRIPFLPYRVKSC